MSKRMTDEVFADIKRRHQRNELKLRDRAEKSQHPQTVSQSHDDRGKLLQALKAERERVAYLEVLAGDYLEGLEEGIKIGKKEAHKRIAELEEAEVYWQEFYQGECDQLAKKNDELEAEIVHCHNPHTGNECDCDICEKAGSRGTR